MQIYLTYLEDKPPGVFNSPPPLINYQFDHYIRTMIRVHLTINMQSIPSVAKEKNFLGP